jgi:hypothetical protein
MCLVVLVSFIYIIFFSDDCKYCCIGTGIKYLFIYLFIYLLLLLLSRKIIEITDLNRILIRMCAFRN